MNDRGNSGPCGNSSFNGGPGAVNDYAGGPLNGGWHWWHRP